MVATLHWDIFCRVIDHHGDLGVCWRLAAQLAARGHGCRLWVDDASALAWMAPGGAVGAGASGDARGDAGAAAGVAVAPFDAAAAAQPGDVVIEAFGCDPPAAFIERMRREAPPAWINLEYLSAEPYVERSHGLASPRTAGPGAGLVKWFFYPGFTPATGGLLRRADAPAAPDPHDAPTQAQAPASVPRQNGERAVFVFAYGHAQLEPLLDALDVQPTLVLAAQGPSQTLLQGLFDRRGHGHELRRGNHLRLHLLPWLSQQDFDAMLDACDFNIVRGEDSLVRALWAGKPFVWNIYAQDDGAHAAKLDAFLDRMLGNVPAPGVRPMPIRNIFRSVNRLLGNDRAATQPLPPLDGAALALWRGAVAPWLAQLRAQEDLVTKLCAFVDGLRLQSLTGPRPPPADG